MFRCDRHPVVPARLAANVADELTPVLERFKSDIAFMQKHLNEYNHPVPRIFMCPLPLSLIFAKCPVKKIAVVLNNADEMDNADNVN